MSTTDNTQKPHHRAEVSLRAALTDLIDHQYNPDWGRSRDELAVGDTQVRISYEVMSGLICQFWGDDPEPELTFGMFDNCREYGLTVTVAGWQFCVYAASKLRHDPP